MTVWGNMAAVSEQRSKKQLDKYGSVAAEYQAKTPLLLPLPTRKPVVTMQAVPASKEVKEVPSGEEGIKAAKADDAKTGEDTEHVAAELVKGAIHRVLASLAAESDATASSEDVEETVQKPKQQQHKKKKGGAKKGGRRK